MKTNELVLVASVIADVIPAIVREPVDAVNPGFMSVDALKLDAVIAAQGVPPHVYRGEQSDEPIILERTKQ